MRKRLAERMAGLLILASLLLTGCASESAGFVNAVRRHHIERIYIEEAGNYVPFLITDIRDEGILLLREHIKCSYPYAYENSGSSYYAGSALDEYLNHSYLKEFPEYIQEAIPITRVQITAESSIGVCGKETEYIERKVFVPSWTEVTGQSNNTGLKEGEQIRNLKGTTLLKAITDSEEEMGWWLRTPNTWYWHLVLAVNSYGEIDTQTTVDGFGIYQFGVRPAFYISGETHVACKNDKWYVVK